jgi:hypothetical protein
MVVTRRENARKVAEALINNVWIRDLAGEMSLELEGYVKCIRLWEAIERVDRNRPSPG